MLQSFIDALGGYLIGVIACLVYFRPLKSWQDGYNTAKEFFGDWDRGFNTGWNAALKAMKEAENEAQ